MPDTADWKRCMDVYGPWLARCAGNRLIVPGYICPHCPSTDPPNECFKPARQSRQSKQARAALALARGETK